MTIIKIDFSNGAVGTDASWNGFSDETVSGVLLSDLLDDQGGSTGVGLEVTSVFNNTTGAANWSTTGVGDFDELALRGAWLTSNGGSSEFKFTGLPSGASYTLYAVGHNLNAGRHTQYTIEGVADDYLSSADAAAPTAATEFTGTVDPDGEIVVGVTKAATGQFYGYATACILTYTTTPSSTITNIDTDNDVQAGQTCTVNGTNFGTNGNVTAGTLGGEAITVNSNTDTTVSVTIPSDIDLLWGTTTNQLLLTVGGSDITLDNVTLSAPTGWEQVTYNGTAPNTSETESFYEHAQTDTTVGSYTMLSGDVLAWETQTGLTVDAQTIPEVDPPATVSGSYKIWKDVTSEWTATSTFTISDLGVFTPDTEAPVIALTGSAIVIINLNDPYTEQGATWTDNVDGSGSATVGGDTVDNTTVGTYVITYNYTDAAGNAAAQVTRDVIVVDPNAIIEGAGIISDLVTDMVTDLVTEMVN